MALQFNWAVWHGEKPGVLTRPDTLCVVQRNYNGYNALWVNGYGHWGARANGEATQEWTWLVVIGSRKELAELDHEVLKDLVMVRYGTGI
jgi:hypothetical protein